MFIKSREFRLIFEAIKDRWGLYLGIVAALISALIAAFIPYIYGRLVDVAIAPNSELKIVAELIIAWIFLSVINNLLNNYSNRRSYEIAVDLTNKLIADLFHHLMNLPLQFHKERKIGKIMNRIDRGISDLYQIIEQTVFSFLPAVLSFFFALIILLFVEWRLSLILILSSITYVLITILYTKDILKRQKTMHRSWEKAWGDLWDSVLNVEAIKASTNEVFTPKNDLNLESSKKDQWRYVSNNMYIKKSL